MLSDLNIFETEALTLPAAQRAELAQHLLATLDDVDEQENEHLWQEEVQRRYRAYEAGTVSFRNAFDDIAEMREQL